MRVVLYYPPVTPQTAFPTWEPLQLLHLTRMLRQTDIETVIVDGRLGDAGAIRGRIAGALSEGDPVCFGVTSLTCHQLSEALSAAEHVKGLDRKIPVVFGGWHATAFVEETLREEAVDIVVRGQGEVTFREVVDRLSAGRDLAGVKGVSWKRGGAVVHEEDRPLVSPDELPALLPSDFEKLDLPHYQLNRLLFYMSSVGCPYSCAYCSIGSACRRRWLPLSAARTIAEIKSLHDRFGFNEVIFWDNVFFTNKRRIEEICSGYHKEGLGYAWSAHARVNEIIGWDDAFLAMIREAGCRSVFIGAESGSQGLLERINKQIKAADILPAFRKLQRHGIDVAVNWMVGFPEESYDDVARSVRCIRDGLALYDYDVNRFKVFIYRFVPFPGTPIFDQLPPEALEALPGSGRAWGDYIHNTVNDGMDPWSLENSPSLFASSSFYLWKAYLQQEAPATARGKLLKLLAKLRVDSGMLRLPLEWRLWKNRHKAR